MVISLGMQRTRIVIQRLFLIGVAMISIFLFIASIHFEREVQNQKTLFYQLQLLRTSIQLFKAVMHRNPGSLEELASLEYQFPDEVIMRRFLEYPVFVGDKKFTDPFGDPYTYDPQTGWVRSISGGYEFW